MISKIIVFVALISLVSLPSFAATDMMDFSLEDLFDLTVVSVSKQEEKVFAASSAVHVITQRDIRRSGYTSIPEALRSVPGLQVARINNHAWAISTRGFNSRHAHKLLVLMDGRSVYTPLSGGTYWDLQDTVMEDIDRIEIIRGPGATVWGANAVNGVINIITRPASEREDGLVVLNASNQHQSATVRGGGSNDAFAYTLYLKADEHNPMVDEEGDDGVDAFDKVQVGFRIDSEDEDDVSFSLQGDFYDGEMAYSEVRTIDVLPYIVSGLASEFINGGNLLGKYERKLTSSSSYKLQVYLDHSERAKPVLSEIRDTVDIDYFHQSQYGDKHALSWGAGYRYTADKIDTPTFNLILIPDSLTMDLYSTFFQDKIELMEDRLWVTVGSKFENNHYSDWEYLPSIRLAWLPSETKTFWSSISRAVHTPTRTTDLEINYVFIPVSQFGPPFAMVLRNNASETRDAQVLVAYEIGFRVRTSERLMFDVAVYYNEYENLFVYNSVEPFMEVFDSGTHLVISSDIVNEGYATVYGGEVSTRWVPRQDWIIEASYSYLSDKKGVTDQSDDTAFSTKDELDPENQFKLSVQKSIGYDFTLNMHFYYIDDIVVVEGGGSSEIPAYRQMNLRLEYVGFDFMDVSFSAQNILEAQHKEFGAGGGAVTYEVPRSYALNFKIDF